MTPRSKLVALAGGSVALAGALVWSVGSGPPQDPGPEGIEARVETSRAERGAVTGEVAIPSPAATPRADESVRSVRAAPPAVERLREEPSAGVHGRVAHADGEPVAGCLVVIEPSWKAPLFARTDDHGNYSLQVDLDDWIVDDLAQRRAALVESMTRRGRRWRDRPSRGPRSERGRRRWRAQREALLKELRGPHELRVSAEVAGGQRAQRVLRVDDGLEGLVRVDLVLREALPFGGEVLGLSGAVALADVHLFDRDWDLLQSTRTDEAGRFAFRPPPDGIYRLHARKPGAGSATGSGTLVRLGKPQIEHALALGGDGTLRGQVLYPDGEPVVGVEIVGVAANLALLAPERPTWPSITDLARFEQHHGLAYARARTDREGRFWMTALQEGSFMLFFEGLGDDYQPPGLYATGPEHAITYRARVLRVLLEGQGEVLLESRVHLLDRSPFDPPPPRKRRHVVASGALGSVELVVDPGTTWGVFWEVGGVLGREQLVRIEDDSYVERVVLEIDLLAEGEDLAQRELPPTEGRGRLEVVLRDAGGERVEARVTLWLLEGARTTRVLSRRATGAGRALPELEPGTYEYRVEPPAQLAPWCLPLESERPLRLEAGRTERVELELVPAGRLRLRLSAEPEAASLPPACRLRLRPEEEGAPSIDLSFRYEGSQAYLRSSLGLDQAALCEPLLAAGTYAIEAYDEEGLRGTSQLRVEAGQITEHDVPVGDLR